MTPPENDIVDAPPYVRHHPNPGRPYWRISAAQEKRRRRYQRGCVGSGRRRRVRDALQPDHRPAKGPDMARVQIRPLGGGPGCLMMILFSIVASVVLTILLNLIIR